jgi:hypothetical protein
MRTVLSILLIATIGASRAESSCPLLFPARYVGFLPCADCGGDIATALTFRANGTFLERAFYRRGRAERSSGSWRYEASSDTFILSRPLGLSYFRAIDPRTLEPLDYLGEFRLQRCPVDRVRATLYAMCERDAAPSGFLTRSSARYGTT